MTPVDVQQLGKASIAANLPELPPESGKRIAVIGGGPAGISVAWQLRQRGHHVTIYDMAKMLGGKITAVTPDSRVPEEIVDTELARVRKVLPHVHLQQRMERKEVEQLREDVDFLVIATGAQKPITLPVPGMERAIPALEFLLQAKAGKIKVGKRLVIIGAGNVGCDVATEAHRLGAEKITLIDIQEPLSFGKERQDAEAVGAEFKWPCFTEEISPKGVKLTTGEIIPADTVVISIGDIPDLEFLPEDVATERGFIVVDEFYQTTDPKLFAIGDVVRPGLLTDAIGAGRKVAEAINEIQQGRRLSAATRQMIDHERMTLEYFDPRITSFKDVDQCGSECLSCGDCRDCGICITLCPQAALSRQETENKNFEIVVDESRCIGCGFCANACPCGIWNLVENEPLE